MSRESYHVVPNPNGGWSVRKTGTERALKHFEKQKDAVNYGRSVCKDRGKDLFVHGRDGTIVKRDSYGNDRYPPKG